MQSNMILETKNGKTLNIFLEFLILSLLFFIFEIIKGIFTLIPILIEIFKIAKSGGMDNEDINGIVSSVTSTPSVTIIMLFSCAVTIIGIIFYCRIIKKRSYLSMGIVKKDAIKSYLTGMLLGAVLLFIIYIVLFICGYTGKISYDGFNYLIILLCFGFLIQSASEEFLMRGYFMNSIAARSNIPLAVIFNSVVFMALHLLNPGVTLISMINILIFGLIFSLLFLLTENIWVVSGMHFLWNFGSGSILGSKVSGLEIKSMFSIPLKGNDLFSGGDFGIEGSVITTVTGIALILILLFKVRNVQK